MQPKSVASMGLTFATIVAVSTLFASTTALAKEYQIKKGHTSGSSITSLFNFQSTGGDSRTNLSTFQGKDSLGDVHGQIVADYDTTGVLCGGSKKYAFKVGISQGVLNYKKGQLFLMAVDPESDPNSGCLDTGKWPAQVTLTIQYFIVGGTGEYEGASGWLESVSTGSLLYNDLTPGDDNQFGSFQSEYTGWFEVD